MKQIIIPNGRRFLSILNRNNPDEYAAPGLSDSA